MPEPPITLRAAHDSGPGNLPPTRVVIHATCPDVGYPAASAPGAAHGTALYFASQGARGSAHYVEGVDAEEHCVPESVIAWHAPPNPRSLGLEITSEGGDYARNYTREQWLSPQVWPAVERAAARCKELCERYDVPKVKLTPADLLAGRRGVCGHVDVSQAWHETTHTDPGPNFPWDRFMAEVTGTGGFLMALTDQQQIDLYNAALYCSQQMGGPNPGWPSFRPGDTSSKTLVDYARTIDATTADTATKVARQAATVDPAALAKALLADPDAVARLGDAIAAGLAARVHNG